MRATVLLAAATACAIPDQKVNPIACANAPLPTTAPATLVISGNFFDPFLGPTVPLPGLTVQAMPSGFTTTTDSQGDFTGMLMTGGAPSASYLKVAGSGPNGTFVDTFYYPATPVATDFDIGPQQIYTGAELAMVGSAAGVPIGSDSSELVVSVVDCGGNAVSGATIVPSSGTVVFFADGHPDPSATSTDTMTGAAIILGITDSETTINATADGIMFTTHQVGTMPGTLTETAISP